MRIARLTVLLTSPRVPAGLLTGPAWRAIFAADTVVVADPSDELALAVAAADVRVETLPDAPSATSLLELASDASVVFLAGDDAEALTTELAQEVVRKAETSAQLGDVTAEDAAKTVGPSVEVMVASYDPVGARLLDLVTVMDRLRSECPWDQEQTHESLVRYLVEEAYETIEAIESGDRDHLREELGDLLLQVMFHSRIAAEDPDAPFDVDDVAGQIVEKLVRRHPHVFGDVEVASAQDVNDNWETIKAAEKARSSAVEGIPPGLPALAWADKVIGRTLSSSAVSASVPTPSESAYTEETLGEVLFALVAAARAAGLDPEQALRTRVRAEIDAIQAQEQGPASSS